MQVGEKFKSIVLTVPAVLYAIKNKGESPVAGRRNNHELKIQRSLQKESRFSYFGQTIIIGGLKSIVSAL